MSGWATLLLAAVVAVLEPTPPRGPSLPSVGRDNDDKLPPPPGAGESDGEETPEEIAARRAQEFEEHLLRAQLAASKERYDEAVREYSAALKLQPGDPAALLGRAQARRARTPPDRCPNRGAISDLRLLET
ncbi:MAG: tetratricopeptide repeat protein, partial [Deltaproteobacteria bacterium]|nr:tetratricopeptide repeat protein [Nannocystaceae bacterium]